MTKLVDVGILSEGVILAEDVFGSSKGVLILKKDTKLDKSKINRMISLGVREVCVYKETLKLKDETYKEEYKKVENKLKNVFDDLAKGNIELNKGIVNDLGNDIKVLVEESCLGNNKLSLLRLLKTKDGDYTINHSIGVSILSSLMGGWIGYPKDKIINLSIAGLFHDIGKLKVPNHILNKPGKLTVEEFEEIKKHSYYGYEILNENGGFNEDVMLGVLQHHERMNGLGYPNKLRGNDIHEYARVISICDVYNACISKRVYKNRENPLIVLNYIRDEGFNSLDPDLTHVFLCNMSDFYIGSKVILNSGDEGNIVYIYPGDRLVPIVKVGKQYIDYSKIQSDIFNIKDIIV